MSGKKRLLRLFSRSKNPKKLRNREKQNKNRFLYIVIKDSLAIDNPPETHFYSGKNAHQYAKKMANKSKNPIYVYKVIKDNYDLDLGYTPRARYGIVAEWSYPPGKS